MAYPKCAVRVGDLRPGIVRQVQRRLARVGCGPIEPDGVFGAETESAVKLFQTRRELIPDGVVGPLTWDELFQETPIASAVAPSELLGKTIEVALSQAGVREDRGRPNRGPQVDVYIRSVGLDPRNAFSWCQAFVYWCFGQAFGARNPCVRTPGVLEHWREAPSTARIGVDAAFDDPRLIRPASVFIVDHGSGRGHAGLVTRVEGGEIHTIEGNTNRRGSRDGDGVYQKVRPIASINTGFIDYGYVT